MADQKAFEELQEGEFFIPQNKSSLWRKAGEEAILSSNNSVRRPFNASLQCTIVNVVNVQAICK